MKIEDQDEKYKGLRVFDG